MDQFFVVLHTASREYFAKMETSSSLVTAEFKIETFAQRLGPLIRERRSRSLSCHVSCALRPRYLKFHPRDHPYFVIFDGKEGILRIYSNSDPY